MSTTKFINAIQHAASLANSNNKFVTTGIITGYDPDNYLVTVQTDDATDDLPASQTGWIPLASMWVGDNCGLFTPPNIGDVCAVYFQDGDSQTLFCSQRFYGDTARPLSVPSGEFWIVHQSGSYLKLTNNGKATINGNVEIDMTAPKVQITVTNDCDINATNINLTATDTINLLAPTVNIGATGGAFSPILAQAAATVFNNHTHDSGTVSVPDQKMTSSDQTTNTKAT